jgi:two-component system, NtrC family, sensor kinase
MISDPARLEREVRAHNRLRELLLRFSQGVSATFSLTAALEALTPGILELLEARTVEIWLHDRRSRLLTLAATAGGGTSGTLIPADDGSHYAAEGLRLERPAIRRGFVVAPLRGWRRALGTLALATDGVQDEAFLDFTYELARQLSVAIENVQLLEDVVRQRRLLEDTFNSLVDLVAVMDNDMRLVQTNAAFALRAGLSRSEVVGRSLSELVGAATFEYARSADPQDSGPAQHRVEDEALGGTFLLTATPLSSQDGRTIGRVLVARDITRQTRLESERAALRERLAQSEKLASLGQFVAGIAHEMNNPLQGVLGHLELLIDMTPDAKPVRKPLKQIYNEADRAAKIVQDLLVFTGSHRMHREPIQIDRILTRALGSRGVHLRRAGIVVTRRKGERLPPICADPSRMQQALLNIVINAEHATRETGGRRIEIETAATLDGKVAVTIHDSGAGIPEDVLPRIFDPFFTTKEVGKGTGLGLAITYGIINEHGGTITAATDPKGGAVFRIELPATETAVVK